VGKNLQFNYQDILDSYWADHLKSKKKNAPTVISLFAGIGGSSLGYSMAGFKELLAVEWNEAAAEIFKLNFPDVPIHCGDISKIKVPQLLLESNLKKGELSVLDGSPPCQGFSIAGRRNFDDERNQLFRQYVRLLKGLKPKLFIMENVAGMVRGKMKLIFAEIMKELKGCGYQVQCQLMDAQFFQVPQQRQRVIFIGVRNDLGIEPSHPGPMADPITVFEAIGNMPIGTPGNHKQHLIEAWQKTKPGKSLRSISQKIDTFECVKVNPHKPSPSILTGRPHWHWKLARRLTVEEMAVSASFPAGFGWCGSKQAQFNGIGNCVPPLFMRALAIHVKDLL
jgi:DNA (cytosine-5)-methyltransferase 1